MRNRALTLLVAIAMCALPAAARAAEPSAAPQGTAPSAERIRSAAEEFDRGRRAFVAGEFEQAAVHFENAYSDAPRAETLRNAIRARRAAKEPARAATLASLAAIQYGSDGTTMALVNETLAALSPQLDGVSLSCEPECGVAADGRVVSLVDARQIGFYLEPGKHELLVSWAGDRTRRVVIDAAAGGAHDLHLVAPVAAPRDAPAATSAPAQAAAPAPTGLQRDRPRDAPSRKPLPPVVFVAGAALTAIGVAATIVSGVDAAQNPGKDAVLRDCVGQGESCPTYQQGKSAELRTNVILGATAGVAVVTAVVGLFFTQWSKQPAVATRSVVPYVGANAGQGPGLGGASLGLSGRF